ncbi:hypothetical protein GOP47_0029112 [Adiantum capillus-veneris]|nr:hypothetical protein GOP47_0029112 [Adiantum capillus-veneris]
MVRPPAKHQGAPPDVDLVNFINDFLFNDTSTSPPLRTTPKYKRYRSMWRAAATSLVAKKRSVSQDTDLSSERRPLKILPSSVSLYNGLSHSADTLTREQPFRLSNDIAARDSHAHTGNNEVTIDVDAASPLATSGGFLKDQLREASSSHAIPKRTSKKPPRPPRNGVLLRSGSYRAVRFKTTTRRAMVDTVGMKKNNMRKSTSNATFIWALIITICFVSIMVFQAFSGDDSKRSVLAIEGQELRGVVFMSPSKMGPSV